jgi:acetyl/propionyl-CoA carboxylase alpha subunit
MDSAALLSQLQTYDAGRKNTVDVLNEAMGKYGVPEIRNRVAGLRTTLTNTENALNSVDPSVTGRTSGSLVTEAQRQKQVTNERDPIMQQYGQISNGLSNESKSLTEGETAARTWAEAAINDWNAGRSALQDRYTTTYQREQDDKAMQMEQAKMRAAAAASGGWNVGGGGGAPAAGAPTDPLKQGAFNDVQTRITSAKSDAELISDFNATMNSAKRGNAKDKAKVEFYMAMRPDLFSGGKVQSNGKYGVLANQELGKQFAQDLRAPAKNTLSLPQQVAGKILGWM